MVKLMKFIGKLIGGVFEWILILLIFLVFAIRTSPFQTFLAQQATTYLSKELKTEFRVDKVSILFFHKVALDGVLIRDMENDTIASIESLFVTIKDFKQSKNLLELSELNLKGGVIKISREKKTGDYNYWFIQDYFDSGKSTSKSKPLDVSLENIRLTNVNVHYDDYRKSYSSFGMDYDHLFFKRVYLYAGNFGVEDGNIRAFIKHISFSEKGGFELNKFSTFVRIEPDGLKLKSLRIKTPFSQVHLSKLNFIMDEIEDFQSFEDSVGLDAKIEKSIVSLKDIAYFGTALEGMDEKISIQARVTEKVKNLRIENLDLRFGEKSHLVGSIRLPDFREFDQAFFKEKLDYAYISIADLEKVKLPKDAGFKHFDLGSEVSRLAYFEAKNLKLDGFYSQFVLEFDQLNTSLGTVKLGNGLLFTENKKNKSFMFNRSESSTYDVKLDSFQLDKFIDNSNFGKVSGDFYLQGEIFSGFDIHLTEIQGVSQRFDFMGYSYKEIDVVKASYEHEILSAEILINDPNLTMQFVGEIGVGDVQKYQFTTTIEEAYLSKLKLLDREDVLLKTQLKTNISGRNLSTYSGDISIHSLMYSENGQKVDLPELKLILNRTESLDHINLQSAWMDIVLNGKLDFPTLVADFNAQFAAVFPTIFKPNPKQKASKNRFNYTIQVNELNPFLAIFLPELKINPGTVLSGNFHNNSSDFKLNLKSNSIQYDVYKFEGITINHAFTSLQMDADYAFKSFKWKDSIRLDSVHFVSTGDTKDVRSHISWNPNNPNEAQIKWHTEVKGVDEFDFLIQPSYFGLNEHRWEMKKEAGVTIRPNFFFFKEFELSYEDQHVKLNGALSDSDKDKLKFDFGGVQINDLATLFQVPADLQGVLNATGFISNPYTNLVFTGNSDIQALYVNKNEVGNLNVGGRWDEVTKSILLNGELFYKNNKTFNFDGNYFLYRKSNQLDFNLDFDYTDIQFANAFLDAEIVSGVRGLLDGQLKVYGDLDSPIIEGKVKLLGGNAKIEMFGVNFGLDGEIRANKTGFEIHKMPLFDEDGNMGMLNGKINHTNYDNWKFALDFNLNEFVDPSTNMLMETNRFLVLNTSYDESQVYYGKAYASGSASISGYADKLDINVNMKSLNGSAISFPMYGNSELEEVSFIDFGTDTVDVNVKQKIDFTGVDLDLNFEVTPETQLKVIFNELTNDEITAFGKGNININLDNLGELKMDGLFTVKKGNYNFVLGVVKQQFILSEGGTIAWTGNPYDAALNIKTYLPVNANMSDIIDIVETKKGSLNTEVNCYLNLTGYLSEPYISFDLTAPNASESGKAAIQRITSDKDELNRQFFSLLVQKKFMPLQGSSSTSGNAAFDLISSQLNSFLGQMTKDVRLNVALDNDTKSGDGSYEFGMSKNFLDNRLQVKGSLGVENYTSTGASNSQSSLIGNVNVEYLLNEQGTFRISIFNESNDYSVVQQKDAGQFTQGVGISYQEEFNNVRDFRLAQTFLDIFRKEKKVLVRKRKRQKRVPPVAGTDATLPEE